MRSRRLLAALVAATLVPSLRASETPCAPATTPFSYRSEPVPNAWASISAPANLLVMPDADDSALPVPFPAGFTFAFYGIAKTSINVCTNGFANFGPGATNFSNAHVDDASAPNDAIFPWYDDLHLGSPVAGGVYRLFDLTAGAEKLTVQWSGVRNYSSFSAATFSFQTILYASTHATQPNTIEFRYNRSSGPFLPACLSTLTATPSATVGCEPATASASAAGCDATERGAGNAAFPPCDLRLTPVPSMSLPGALASMTVVPQEPFCSIVGVPGTVAVPISCNFGQPCTDNDNSAATMGGAIPLPWKFSYLGRVFANANMNANGVMQLGAGQPGVPSANDASPLPTEPDAMLAPFWDGLEGAGPGSGMYFRVDGLPGCRVMTFEWAAMRQENAATGDCVAGGLVSFQVKLFEGSAGSLAASAPVCPYDVVVAGEGNDRIEFRYDHLGFLPAVPAFTATIGFEDHVGAVGGSLAGTASAAPPAPGGVPSKVVIDTCDYGTVRYYGERNNNAPPGAGACLPEIKSNFVPPMIGNGFGLQMIGSTSGAFALLMLDFTGPLAGTRTPVPCGGLPFPPFGTFWVNPLTALVLPRPLPTSAAPGACQGCSKLDLPIPLDPTLIGGIVFAQWAAIYPAPWAPGLGVELTEGAKIVIGG